MIRLGLISFSDGRLRVHESLTPDIQNHAAKLKKIMEATGEVEIVLAEEIVHSVDTARREAKRMAARDLDGVILNIAVFAFPNFVVLAAQACGGPYLPAGLRRCLKTGGHCPRAPVD
jgi:L-fucose isomerase